MLRFLWFCSKCWGNNNKLWFSEILHKAIIKVWSTFSLEGYTRISAYLSRDEKIKGSLEVGMLADMVVLEENLYTCKPEHIKDIRVDMTIVNGEIKYSRN